MIRERKTDKILKIIITPRNPRIYRAGVLTGSTQSFLERRKKELLEEVEKRRGETRKRHNRLS